MHFKLTLGTVLLLFTSAESTSYRLTHPLYNPGFFSVFNMVLGALDYYETNSDCTGFSVDFENQGLYYDGSCGSNWWEYYFEPICLGSQTEEEKFPTYKKITFSLSAQFEMSRDRGFELLKRYVHLKPDIQTKLDEFVEKQFENHNVIGVHYRGTDKKSEAPEVSYQEVADRISIDVEEENTKVFVATDDELFLLFMQEKFPEKIISIDAIRSSDGTPVHYDFNQNAYKKGEDAILDCVLLSKCTKIYKMASNLSDTSLKFNPEIQAEHLNKSYSEGLCTGKQNIIKVINTALHLLNEHERNGTDFVITVPITQTNYSDREGSNWWDYHFLPLSARIDAPALELSPFSLTRMGLPNLFEMSPTRAHELIGKYIRLQPGITQKIESVLQKEFQGHYIIGVNYNKQNTKLQPDIPYEEFFAKIKTQIELNAHRSYKIFLITQDAQFFDKIQELFSPIICMYHPAQKGLSFAEHEELQLIESILLSKSNIVIGSSSELLKLTSQFNPDMPIIKLGTLWLEKE